MPPIQGQIRVLVVDDSAFMRRVITDLLHSDPLVRVVGTAPNGAEALKQIVRLHPDVVTLDLEMPVLDGLATLERIMQERPLPVIILSSLVRGAADLTIKALQRGAVDFVTKPSGRLPDLAGIREELLNKVKMAAGVEVNRTLKVGRPAAPSYPGVGKAGRPGGLTLPSKLILIGTSTGGPQALHTVLARLPGGLPAALIIVQHMPAAFTCSLAERLNQSSQLRVKEAEDGERVRAGTAYLARGDYHLVLDYLPPRRELLLRLNQDAPVNGHRPSVDVLMYSAARINCCEFLAVIMTGMGHDGRDGVRRLKEQRGARVIAEDASTAVVYGMPRAVIEAGLADQVVPLPLIAREILHLLEPHKN